ncbi:MAG TPA: IclR family transcriptional regulator [Acidimicrobiales bacterium]|nr:IclR family transcriptional regulator [Acidimicrobiales bacterium]
MDTVSGIGVLDKAVSVLDAVERGPLTLAALVEATGMSRATAHRLAVALEVHGFLRRDGRGRFTVGPRLTGGDLAKLALPALGALRDRTGESTQLYVRRGDRRLCIASLESPHGLRTIVPVGASLPLDVGSAGKVLRGDLEPDDLPSGERRWAESVEERERGVASVSAPVRDGEGRVVAAVSVSGPIERTTRTPGRRYADAVVEAAASIGQAVQLVARQGSSGWEPSAWTPS